MSGYNQWTILGCGGTLLSPWLWDLCVPGAAVKRHMMMMGVMTTTGQECQKDDYYQRGELYCIVSTSHHKTPVTSLAGIPCVPCLALTALLCSALSLLILHVLYDPKKQQRHVRDLQPTAGKYVHKAHPHSRLVVRSLDKSSHFQRNFIDTINLN